MQRLWPWFLILLALAPAALVHPTTPRAPAHVHAVVVIGVVGGGATFNPAVATTMPDRLVADNLFPTLFKVSPQGLLAPGLALNASESGNLVSVTLGADRLADQTPLTPAMVVQALSETLWPSTDSSAARSLLGDVKGAGAVEAGKAQYISGMAETGPRTLQITLTKPVSNWVWRLANPALGIVPVSDLVHGGAYWSIADLIGTGPFRVVADAPTAAMQFEPLGARARTPLIELERYGSLEEAALALVNGEASAVSVPVRSLGAMLVKPFRPHLRFLAATPQIELVINPAAANPWAAATANGPAIGRVVRAAFHGLVPSAPGFIPSVSSPQVSSPASSAAPSTAPPSSSSPPARAPLPLYVDGQDAMAMAIAASLERTVPGFYRVTVLSGPAWTTALQHGSIPAALVRTWPGGPLPAVISSWKAISLAPSGSFWLLAPQVRAASVLANGALDWNMFTSRHG